MNPNASLLLKRIMERYLMPEEEQTSLWMQFEELNRAMADDVYNELLDWLVDEGYIELARHYFIPTPLADWAEEQGLLDAIPPSRT